MKPEVRALLRRVPSTDAYDEVFHPPIGDPPFEMVVIARHPNGAVIARGNYNLVFRINSDTGNYESRFEYRPL
jgi:hypothetical protein